ncbi:MULTISPECIES: glutathione S-transferase family protein [unclassified Pseudomonas]|uniref:glutathione S-transferase family protein n=1 Tax=unclassified Pseudomonas TaxID=196821 RepID=UPI0008399450|nr:MULTISPECIES: glutathione S-transferase family protein [unclassified Pseudomonas]QIH10764.1 glutathione S-transferase family protein [Pseudomonas sp. BIOMIG1BAC]
MKVYGDRGSSNTRRVLATAAYLELEVEFIFLDLFTGQNRTPEYLALNPNGTIPTFVDGDLVLFEASAIMIYLAEKTSSSLLPTGNARYETLKWMFWAAEHFRRGPTVLIEQRFMDRLKGHDEEEIIVAEALRAIDRYATVLDGHLRNRKFMVGDSPTLADFDLAAPFSHIPRTRAPLLEYPHVAAWYERVNELAVWQNTGVDQEHRIHEIERLFTPAL